MKIVNFMFRQRNAVLFTVSVLFLFSCSKKETVKEEVLRPIKYFEVGNVADLRERSFSGMVKAGDEIELSFRSNGIIQEVNVSKGEQVKKGALIARLDNVEANLAYEKSISVVNSARSAMNTAKTELDRVKALYEKQSVSLSEYEGAKNNYQLALSEFESAQRNQSIQKTQLNYGYIYAPKDGIIANTEGSLNERVAAGHVFAILNAGNQMKIEVGIPENIINEVEMGMETEILIAALGEGSFKGEVIEVSPILDENAATYTVNIGIEDETEDIKQGMAAKVTFKFGKDEPESEGIIIVPLNSVGEDSDGNFVFVIEPQDDETGTIKKQPVEIGEIVKGGIEIKSGLSNGELIATAGLQSLLDGQKVRLK